MVISAKKQQVNLSARYSISGVGLCVVQYRGDVVVGLQLSDGGSFEGSGSLVDGFEGSDSFVEGSEGLGSLTDGSEGLGSLVDGSGFLDGARCRLSDDLFRQVLEYFAGERLVFDVRFEIEGVTQFQRQVLEELQRIPYGEQRSYRAVAEAVESPRAARAVGGACNRNPLHLIVPCHRVVGAGGALTGFAAGVAIKRKLLEAESIV
ncbi:MAG: methylated-DNA--[protein]-cysteine S-methyltransferase [Rikenellaceae bacterium]